MDQPSLNTEQIALIKRTLAKGCTADELALFVQQCNRTGLDPFARQIYAVKRWDRTLGRDTMSVQVSIDGFRLVAERSGKYAGQLGPWWTADGKSWLECWLSHEAPAAARVGVIRADFKEPLFAVARWDSYKQEGKNGLTPLWKKMPDLMLAKVAEALALRRAFPAELSGLYTPDELAQAEGVPSATPSAPTEVPAIQTQADGDDSRTADFLSALESITDMEGYRALREEVLIGYGGAHSVPPILAAELKATRDRLNSTVGVPHEA